MDPSGLQPPPRPQVNTGFPSWEEAVNRVTAWVTDETNWRHAAESLGEAYLLYESLKPGPISSEGKAASEARTIRSVSKGATRIATELAGEAPLMQIVREVKPGEKWINVLSEMKALTFSESKEYAVVRLHDGTRALVVGGERGMQMPDSVKRVIIHSHPYHLPPTGPSPDDFQMLIDLGQKRSYIIEHGVLIKYTIK